MCLLYCSKVKGYRSVPMRVCVPGVDILVGTFSGSL